MTISVIIPFYNVQAYTDELLERLKPQIKEDVEVIVVDDGSTPAFTTNYEWVKVIRQENKGPSAARNRGLDEAKGKYIVFIDADDLVAVNYLDSLRGIMPFDYAEFSWKSLPGGANFNRKLLNENDRLRNPSVVTRAFSRACIGDIRFNENKWAAEDEEFTRKVCTPDKVRRVILEYMYFYRTSTPNSITKRFRAGKLPNKIVVYHYPFITQTMYRLLYEIKQKSLNNEVIVMCDRNEIPAIAKYARIVSTSTYVEGMELIGESNRNFHKIK